MAEASAAIPKSPRETGDEGESWVNVLGRRGWLRFPYDPELFRWVEAVRDPAMALADREDLQAQWLRCGGTWFAGVNALANSGDGSVPREGVPPLSGRAVSFVRENLGFGSFAWDRAQISVCYPGYPQPSGEESEAAFRYRVKRHAAHVDGIARDGAGRRHFSEAHGFLLGIPLVDSHPGASPLSVWEGSHAEFRKVIREAFEGTSPTKWHEMDITEHYQETRRRCFEEMQRITIGADAGEAYLIHRLALHGISPWTASASASPRAVAYFRPVPFPCESPKWWLDMH